ncbi:hypothetical protein BXY85_3753 [Roseivirga pacifica]|uniref:Uncharacterized protein n=1 Tax=Roseivirga pacifica TaxID=1267423 RepID=A0A1I0Q8V3_9BACT|nr:hypothetical protein [Roseivirga pacifica]RKQ43134.1 hypothetical protein BXY85_3753 [Roseivirga pacifica]SEW23440.1 hypothetical protein SAMN05216290_2122 [Roseivirga pacifica]
MKILYYDINGNVKCVGGQLSETNVLTTYIDDYHLIFAVFNNDGLIAISPTFVNVEGSPNEIRCAELYLMNNPPVERCRFQNDIYVAPGERVIFTNGKFYNPLGSGGGSVEEPTDTGLNGEIPQNQSLYNYLNIGFDYHKDDYELRLNLKAGYPCAWGKMQLDGNYDYNEVVDGVVVFTSSELGRIVIANHVDKVAYEIEKTASFTGPAWGGDYFAQNVKFMGATWPDASTTGYAEGVSNGYFYIKDNVIWQRKEYQMDGTQDSGALVPIYIRYYDYNLFVNSASGVY